MATGREMSPLPTSPPHGYDHEVWNELPPEIQQELIEARGGIRLHQVENSSLNQKKNSEKLKQLSLRFSKSSSEIESWKDPSFPPLPCSVDGRKDQSRVTMTASSSSSSQQPKCKCGKEMVSRQVSKVGINHGRYFYSCPQRQCNSFIWAEGVPHRPAVMNLEWKHFSHSDGWKMVTSAGYLAGTA